MRAEERNMKAIRECIARSRVAAVFLAAAIWGSTGLAAEALEPAGAPGRGTPVSAAAPAHRTAEELPSGAELMRRMQMRPDSNARVDTLRVELHDRDGGVRKREARMLRKVFPDATRTLFVFDAPANIAGTALLTVDYDDLAREDDRWLYLPASRKSRRVSAARRTEGFMGGDFSYEDIRNEARLRPEEYRLRTTGHSKVGGRPCVQAEAIPKNTGLGYARLEVCVDTSIWMPLRFVMYDNDSVRIKTITMADLREANGVWTAYRRVARNDVNGHVTVVVSESVERDVDLKGGIFTREALARGGR